MLSRAVAGIYHGKVLFSTPGSPAAVKLAWEKLIAPEVQHLVWELTR
jgi:molybdenum cofactor biosynthesis protein B